MNKNFRNLLLILSMLGLVVVVFWAVGLLPTAVSPDANASVTQNPVKPPANPAYVPGFWFEGADGYDKANSLHQSSHAAVIVYVYTDWCPYCKRVERELLRSEEVGEFLKSVVKVKINPEAGPDSSALARRLGISSYPFIFVIPRGSDQPTQIHPFKRVGDSWQPMQPVEFVQACRQAGAP